MKKYIIILGSVLMLAGCQGISNSVADSAVGSLSLQESSSDLEIEASSGMESAGTENQLDIHYVVNEENSQEGLQKLVDYVEPGDYLLPTVFVERSEDTYFSGFAYQTPYGDYSLHIIEPSYQIEGNPDEYEQYAKGEPTTNIGVVIYGSAEAAEAQVAYEDAHEIWLENPYNQQTLEFDLGHEVTGYMLGNTHDQTISWNDEQWFVEFYASNYESTEFEKEETAATMARQLVTQLQETPLPEEAGTGHYYVSYDGATGRWFSRVLWTIGEIRYEVNAEEKGTAAVVEMARGMKRPQ